MKAGDNIGKEAILGIMDAIKEVKTGLNHSHRLWGHKVMGSGIMGSQRLWGHTKVMGSGFGN